MRRFLLFIMLCLLPLQISWAAVSDVYGHGGEKTAQHFGHHDDGHEEFSAPSKQDLSSDLASDKQPGKLKLGHDHCHMSVFFALVSETSFHAFVSPQQVSFRFDERAYTSPALDKPKRPKWSHLA